MNHLTFLGEPCRMPRNWNVTKSTESMRRKPCQHSNLWFPLFHFFLILGIVCYGNQDYHQYQIGREVKALLPRSEKASYSYNYDLTYFNHAWPVDIYVGIYSFNATELKLLKHCMEHINSWGLNFKFIWKYHVEIVVKKRHWLRNMKNILHRRKDFSWVLLLLNKEPSNLMILVPSKLI